MLSAQGHHHNYKRIGENEKGIVEVCKECGKKLVTKKYNGKIDNEKYRKEHIRDFAQPNGNTGKIFDRYYGKR